MTGPWVAPKKVQGSPGPDQHSTLGQRKKSPPRLSGPNRQQSLPEWPGPGPDVVSHVGGGPGQAASRGP